MHGHDPIATIGAACVLFGNILAYMVAFDERLFCPEPASICKPSPASAILVETAYFISIFVIHIVHAIYSPENGLSHGMTSLQRPLLALFIHYFDQSLTEMIWHLTAYKLGGLEHFTALLYSPSNAYVHPAPSLSSSHLLILLLYASQDERMHKSIPQRL